MAPRGHMQPVYTRATRLRVAACVAPSTNDLCCPKVTCYVRIRAWVDRLPHALTEATRPRTGQVAPVSGYPLAGIRVTGTRSYIFDLQIRNRRPVAKRELKS